MGALAAHADEREAVNASRMDTRLRLQRRQDSLLRTLAVVHESGDVTRHAEVMDALARGAVAALLWESEDHAPHLVADLAALHMAATQRRSA